MQNDAAGPNGGSPGGEPVVNAGPIAGESSSTVNSGAVQKETVIRANNV